MPATRALALGLTALSACSSAQQRTPQRTNALPSQGAVESTQVTALEPGVIATRVAPERLDTRRPVALILYALPNGNSTAETIGQRITDGVGWRFDIQHIGAQTRALRARGLGLEQAIVVYLEAEGKSWPAWRSKLGYARANARIAQIVNEIRTAIGEPEKISVTLTGHSGGGSFMFGFIEAQATIPNWLDRIALLDTNYNFEASHGDKLLAWLRADARHRLISLAYDDREITLDGKKVVSDSGGTWRATERMINHLSSRAVRLTHESFGTFDRYSAAQIELLRHPNPQNRILHTEMIGEMNGYMHALLQGRAGYGDSNSVLHAAREYSPFVEGAIRFPAPGVP